MVNFLILNVNASSAFSIKDIYKIYNKINPEGVGFIRVFFSQASKNKDPALWGF